MTGVALRRYDNSRREAGVRATRLRVVAVAKQMYVELGYPATTMEAIAQASGVAVPTLYRLFGTKRNLLKTVLDTSFVGDDEPVAFGDRLNVRAALAASEPQALIDAFAVICRETKDRAADIYQVLVSAALVDSEAAELLADIRSQAHTGRSRIVTALRSMDALDPALDSTTAQDMVYACLSFEVAHILTVERGWGPAEYEAWISRSLRCLLRPDRRPRRSSARAKRPPKEA
jgi:AcrR family transcriptional regulator